jgi:Collagen triple helix repeat (20 copies)
MFSIVRRHMTYTNIAATMAVVFAMSGGAYAVSDTHGGGHQLSTALISAKKKVKKPAGGKPGPRGPAGSQGPAGPAGPTGPAGTNGTGEKGPQGNPGTNGSNGTAGTNGTNGTSATTETFTGEAHGCKDGGVVIKSASPETVVCNGEGGASGFTSVLPAEKTETGAWATGKLTGTPGIDAVPISFAIPLPSRGAGKTALGQHAVHFIAPDGNEIVEGKEEPPSVACEGGTVEEPTAKPGSLCIYASTLENFDTVETEVVDPANSPTAGAGTAGTMIWFYGATAEAFAFGTWAVTAPAA